LTTGLTSPFYERNNIYVYIAVILKEKAAFYTSSHLRTHGCQ
jgi:hypothetical protein